MGCSFWSSYAYLFSQVARLLGYNDSKARPVMEEIYELEAKLAKIYVPREKIRDPKTAYKKVKVIELCKY